MLRMGAANKLWHEQDPVVAKLRDAGALFRNDMIEGPGGKQILLQDPSGNVVELFQPAFRNPALRSPLQLPEQIRDWFRFADARG